jgi:hypothetical protein
MNKLNKILINLNPILIKIQTLNKFKVSPLLINQIISLKQIKSKSLKKLPTIIT